MFGKPKKDATMLCPFIGHKPCLKYQCALYVEMDGTDINNDKKFIRTGACSIAWLPKINLEGNQMVREHGAATESLRNRVDEANKVNKETQNIINKFITFIGSMMPSKQKITENDNEGITP